MCQLHPKCTKAVGQAEAITDNILVVVAYMKMLSVTMTSPGTAGVLSGDQTVLRCKKTAVQGGISLVSWPYSKVRAITEMFSPADARGLSVSSDMKSTNVIWSDAFTIQLSSYRKIETIVHFKVSVCQRGLYNFIRTKSGLPGRFKAWLYQHYILPRNI